MSKSKLKLVQTRTINISNSYNFIDKAPIIDEIRTLIQDRGVTESYVCYKSGVGKTTIKNWFNGHTKRPQAPTLNMVLRVFGKKLGVVDL
jgi:hypothetical protein